LHQSKQIISEDFINANLYLSFNLNTTNQLEP